MLFGTWRRRHPDEPGADEMLREQFFAASRACLRASPLGKRHGWGLHFDSAGRVALLDRDSDLYRRAEAGDLPGVTVRRALRTTRR